MVHLLGCSQVDIVNIDDDMPQLNGEACSPTCLNVKFAKHFMVLYIKIAVFVLFIDCSMLVR